MSAFWRCSQLTVVNLSKGLEEIGVNAFSECASLHEISIPPTVNEVKDRAFYWCSQLTTVILGKGLKEIRRSSFACTSLHEIVA